MILPEIAPTRAECQRQILEAFRSEGARIYVDASVLIHCYEMSRSAAEELLTALDGLGDKVRVPVWSAKETWDHTNSRRSRNPLAKTSANLTKQLTTFRTESLRYVDERTFEDMSMEQFAEALDELVAVGDGLTRRANRVDAGHDDASARLIPFISAHALESDMGPIYDEISRTGEMRFAHEVPPGFKDGKSKTIPAADEDGEEVVQQTGKKKNRFGDLIMWLEALQDCGDNATTHLIILTRDNKKGDWVYNPDKVVDEEGRPQQNGGVVTLPLPLLVQEAKKRCSSLAGVHVISLEMLIAVLRSGFGIRLNNLVRALQADTAVVTRRPTRREGRSDARAEGEAVEVSFGSQDMMYEPSGDEESSAVWQEIVGLRAEGWTVQNAAAAALGPMMAELAPNEAKQVGRGIVVASNEEALGPAELAREALANTELPTAVRANLLVGLIGETYFDDDGEPKKPMAHPDIASILFEHARDVDTRCAYEVTIEGTLEPVRRLYLALPGENDRSVRIELLLNGNILRGCQADGKELLEADAPASRQIVSGGRSEQIPVGAMLEAIAREFVVPMSMLGLEGPTNFQIELPERIGFIDWGPSSGEQLR